MYVGVRANDADAVDMLSLAMHPEMCQGPQGRTSLCNAKPSSILLSFQRLAVRAVAFYTAEDGFIVLLKCRGM